MKPLEHYLPDLRKHKPRTIEARLTQAEKDIIELRAKLHMVLTKGKVE